jgi:hypothetical protein
MCEFSCALNGTGTHRMPVNQRIAMDWTKTVSAIPKIASRQNTPFFCTEMAIQPEFRKRKINVHRHPEKPSLRTGSGPASMLNACLCDE